MFQFKFFSKDMSIELSVQCAVCSRLDVASLENNCFIFVTLPPCYQWELNAELFSFICMILTIFKLFKSPRALFGKWKQGTENITYSLTVVTDMEMKIFRFIFGFQAQSTTLYTVSSLCKWKIWKEVDKYLRSSLRLNTVRC